MEKAIEKAFGIDQEMISEEQVQQSISAAYDSVDVINRLKEKESLIDIEVDFLERNKQHIAIMLTKEWFVNGLTEEQKIELETIKL